MPDRTKQYDEMADATMGEILAEAGDPASPTITPFVTLGGSDPGEEMFDDPTTAAQAEAHDLWQVFGHSS